MVPKTHIIPSPRTNRSLQAIMEEGDEQPTDTTTHTLTIQVRNDDKDGTSRSPTVWLHGLSARFSGRRTISTSQTSLEDSAQHPTALERRSSSNNTILEAKHQLSASRRHAGRTRTLSAFRSTPNMHVQAASASLTTARQPLLSSIIASAHAHPVPSCYNDVVHVPCGQRCRVFIISDVHADHAQNRRWLAKKMPAKKEGCFDVCIIAGDVSDDLKVLGQVLQTLKGRFAEVMFTAGNHELWVGRTTRHRPDERAVALQPPKSASSPTRWSVGRGLQDARGGGKPSSVHKLMAVLELCRLHSVRCAPIWLKEQPSSVNDQGGILLFPPTARDLVDDSHLRHAAEAKEGAAGLCLVTLRADAGWCASQWCAPSLR